MEKSFPINFTRHYWPGPTLANTGAIGVTVPTGSYTAAVAGADDFPTSHAVFYQWVLTLSRNAGDPTPFTIATPLARFVVGCTQADTDGQLTAAIASHIADFDFTNPLSPLWRANTGYLILPHRRSSILGNGLTLSNIPVSLGLGFIDLGLGGLNLFRDQPRIGEPDLLFFEPRDQRENETAGEYATDLSNPTTNNAPYGFIGVAHTWLYNPAERPTMGCIPSDAWFVHEAGYHLDNGLMLLTPPVEARKGLGNMLQRPQTPPRPTTSMLWHPRLWDIHIWNDPGGGTPVMQIFRPQGVPGLRLEADGAEVVFFHPRTWQ